MSEGPQGAPPPWGWPPPGAGPPPGYGPGPVGPQAGPPPWPQPARKNGQRWILVAAAVLLVVAVAAAFGIWRLTSDKPPQNKAVDLSKLDVGHYGTKPRPVPGPTTKEEGKVLEGFRIAEGIPDPYDVDPVLDHIYGQAVTDPKVAATSVAGTSTPLTQPVLEKYGMIAAYLVEAVSKTLPQFLREKSGDTVLIMLTSFPSEDAAAHAAAEMDAIDFAVNNQNQVVAIPGYPQAKAHGRPNGYPSIGSTTPTGRFVASISARSDAHPDFSYLAQRVRRTLDLLVPLAAKVNLDDESALTSLPLDPDNMLSRMLVPEQQPKVSPEFETIGPRAAIFCAGSQALKDGLFEEAGVDRCSSGAMSQLERAKDEAAATSTLPKLVEAARVDVIDHDITPPDGLAVAKCYEAKQELWADSPSRRFVCYLSYGRYIAAVGSNDEKDVKQRAAAQYSILANSK